MATSNDAVPARPFVPKRRPNATATPDPWLKPGILMGGLVPLVAMAWRAKMNTLSADPIAEVENELGLVALVFLIASLACTPARRLFGWTWAPRIRRQLGLFAFFYGVLHFLTYLLLDQNLNLGTIFEDIGQRPFITVGFLALVLMTPLAFTSTTGSVRRLGFRRWTWLHRLAYVSGVLAVIHFIWRVKIDVGQPVIYAFILGTLLGVRVLLWLAQRFRKRAKPSA